MLITAFLQGKAFVCLVILPASAKFLIDFLAAFITPMVDPVNMALLIVPLRRLK